MDYRITVIMGIYNCADTLGEALDSLYAQTYQNFKIVLCDDGSKDNTYAVAKEYADKHGNIILIQNDRNRGLNYTLNHCLQYADTEYIARMDGDDISLPTRFEKEINVLDQHPEYAVVSCHMIHFDELGDFGGGDGEDGEPPLSKFNYGPPFCHAPCMMRTAVMKEVGGYSEDKWLLRVEDYNLWTKVFAHGHKGYNLGEALYKMRDDRNATARRTKRSRLNNVYAHWLAYRSLNISLLWFLIDASKNLLLIITPTFIYDYLHRKKTRGN